MQSREAADLGGLLQGLVLDVPERLTDVTSWHTHIPFAFWCAEAVRPRVFVELGTHRGDSYAAFCQAVDKLALPTACFAVDTWKGDSEAGYYGEDILRELRQYHDERYGRFSRLLQETFDEASRHFAEGSIDLLHVDGLHTYDAVRHDFEIWLPLMSTTGVILFHDISVREADFGVWRLWEEVQNRYPSFAFHHGHGLGVLAVGPDVPADIGKLVTGGFGSDQGVRRVFASLGELVALRGELARTREKARLLAEQLQQESATRERAVADRARAVADRVRAESQVALAQSDVAKARAHATEVATSLSQEAARLKTELERARAKLGRGSTEDLARSLGGLPGRIGHSLRVGVLFLYWGLTLQLGRRLRERRYARLIRRSGLFLQDFYLRQRPRSRAAKRDPVIHYLRHGASAGLDPNPFFDTSDYLARYPEVAADGKNPLVHYIREGEARGLLPSQGFDPAFYARGNSDVLASGLSPLVHYLRWGHAAGRPCLPPPEERNQAQVATDLLDRAGEFADPARAQRILVVDHRMLTPDHDSGSVRMLAILKLLRRLGHEVTFVSDSELRMPSYETAILELGVDILYGSAEASRHLEDHGPDYAAVLLSRPEVADRYLSLVRAHALRARVVYDTVDLHWVRLERAAEVSGEALSLVEAQRYRRLEGLACTCADLVLAITPQEKRTVEKEFPGVQVEIIPNIHATVGTFPVWEARHDLMFIGGFEHKPNIDAMEWFVGEILPLIREHLPHVMLHIVGSKTPESVTRLASAAVRVHGYVRDVVPLFERSRVFVSPLRYGAGMKGKIGQSMGHGLPVVTTSIGSEGMMLTTGENALIADDAVSFAAAVVRIYRDASLWSRISREALRHVSEHFGEEPVFRRLKGIFPPNGLRVDADGPGRRR